MTRLFLTLAPRFYGHDSFEHMMRCCLAFPFSRWSGILLTLSKIPKGFARLPRIPYFGIFILFYNVSANDICIMLSIFGFLWFVLGIPNRTWSAFTGLLRRDYAYSTRFLSRSYSLRRVARDEVLIARVFIGYVVVLGSS
jgi:hypothetical protein